VESGSYIASAYRSLHLRERDFIIDSNVIRLYGRFFGFSTDSETRRKRSFLELADRATPARRF
jgi:A/G-specific adenine glycosylase